MGEISKGYTRIFFDSKIFAVSVLFASVGYYQLPGLKHMVPTIWFELEFGSCLTGGFPTEKKFHRFVKAGRYCTSTALKETQRKTLK